MPGSLKLATIARLSRPPLVEKLPERLRGESDPRQFAEALVLSLGVPKDQARSRAISADRRRSRAQRAKPDLRRYLARSPPTSADRACPTRAGALRP